MKAVASGYIDVLMYPVNPAFDTLCGDMDLEETLEDNSYYQSVNAQTKPVIERRELYHSCSVHNIGIIAMKPYAAGRFFNARNASGIVLTPVQCLHYALSQPGVCTVVPGCKNTSEMKKESTFIKAGWDFINIWGLVEG